MMQVLHAESSLRDRGLSRACFSSSRVEEIIGPGYTFDAGNFIIVTHTARLIQPGIVPLPIIPAKLLKKNVPFGEFSF
jgi:hypothetical protein